MKTEDKIITSVLTAGIGIIATKLETSIREESWEKKRRRNIDDEFEDIDDLISELRRKVNKYRNSTKTTNPVVPKTDEIDASSLTDCLNRVGVPYVPLLGSWIVEGQNAIIFSQSDQGKTSLTMQIALDFALGQPSLLFKSDTKSYSPSKVIYYNGELDDGDLKERFPDSTLFQGIDFTLVNGNPYGTTECFLLDVEERMAGLGKHCVVFIDNITKYFPTFQSETARQFFTRMESLQAQVKKNNPNASLTFVLVGHTSKTGIVPLQQEHLLGSGNLSNFIKTIIALGATKTSSAKYIKLIKAKHHMTGDPVIVVRKLSHPYWHFEFLAEMNELDAMEFCADDLGNASEDTEPKQRGRKKKVSDEEIKNISDLVNDTEHPRTVEDAIKELGLDITEKTYYERRKNLAL